MKVIVMIKANKDSENGIMPSEKLLTEMGAYNEQLVKAGIMLTGEGLHPSKRGKRLFFGKGKPTVQDGPFAETKELIAGYWVWQVKSMDEAVEWARRIPNPDNTEGQVEIRQVFTAEDFGAEYTPELREKADKLQAQIERQQKK